MMIDREFQEKKDVAETQPNDSKEEPDIAHGATFSSWSAFCGNKCFPVTRFATPTQQSCAMSHTALIEEGLLVLAIPFRTLRTLQLRGIGSANAAPIWQSTFSSGGKITGPALVITVAGRPFSVKWVGAP